MKNCREFEDLIDRVHAGEASSDENDLVLEHIECCASCSELFDVVGRVRAGADVVEPSAADFAAMRLGVLRGMTDRSKRREVAPWWVSLQTSFLRPAFVAVLAIAMLGVGWMLGGRGRSKDATPMASGPGLLEPGDEMLLASQIQRVAARNSDFDDVANSPFVYSNVKVEASTPESIRLSFDVSRHLDLELDRGDPLVTEVLVQSLIQPASTGTKLKAIDLTGELMDKRAKKALMVAMQNDENLGVRMMAQSKLAPLTADDEVIGAMLVVLERDDSVQMRLAAIDYLTQSKVRPELLERAIESAGSEETSSAVYLRASQYLTSENTNSH